MQDFMVPLALTQTLVMQDGPRPPGSVFKWRMSNGVFVKVTDMSTRHLFFTLRMIWNHTMPEEYWLTPFRRYTFDEFYTTSYMKNAVLAVANELFQRTDILPHFQDQLDRMKDVFIDHPDLLTQ